MSLTQARVSVPANALNVFDEARSLLDTGAHLLLLGPDRIMFDVFEPLRDALRQPVWETDAETFSLPTNSLGTLIVRQVERLVAADQVRLFQWMIADRRRTQIVTMAQGPLFPLVQCGAFLESLYYALNTVQLQLWGRPVTPSPIGLEMRFEA